MASARSVWKGFIRFGLVSVPVRSFTAAESGGGSIALNQLHKECNTRIQYKKTCPVHGEVAASDIVSGFQFAKDQYVVIDPQDVEKLRTPAERAINIQAFIAPDTVDPIYFSGKSYYLAPDGPMGAKPYSVLQRVMKETSHYAFAQVVMGGHDQIVLLRPVENLLLMSMLNYEQEMRKPAVFADEAPVVEATAAEMKMAKMLVDSLTEKKFDFSQYRDSYTDNLRKLIEAKVAGQDVIEAPSVDVPTATVNLMEALERSLANADRSTKAPKKPAKMVAPSTAARGTGGGRKRKSS
jgi:DNA end-binding protein Ku